MLPIPAFVVNHHPRAQDQRQHKTRTSKRRGRRQRRDVFGRVFVEKDVGRDDAHQVGQRHAKGSEHDAAALVGDVVIVPDVEKDGRGRSTPLMTFMSAMQCEDGRGANESQKRTRSS